MIPKFRAWDTHEEVMNRVDYIDFANGIVGLSNENVKDYEQPIHRVKFMQSTNLLDKNGVEIYEGDVVNITQYFGGHPYGEIKYIVKRSEYNNNLVADSESGDWRTPEVSMSFRKSDDYEVIGNIYENSELLEEEE